MKHAYLEVTYRRGRPLAAYLYLPRRVGDKSIRAERVEGGLVLDYGPDGRAIGIEIVSPSKLDIAKLNGVLVRLGYKPVTPDELAPLAAA